MAGVDALFVDALLASPSFYSEVLVWVAGGALLSLGLLILAKWLAVRRGRRLAALAADQSGAAAAVDFVLTIPIFLTVLLLIAQFVSLAHDALIVHYSAFSAARSARVWLWEPPARGPLGGIVPLPSNPFSDVNTSDEVRRNVERAARFALIAASPSGPEHGGSGSAPRAVLRSLAGAAGQSGRAGVLANQARYAFDPRNSTIEFEATGGPFAGFGGGSLRPVKAKVTFRAYLGIPVAKVLGTNAGGGHYYREISAEMTLL